MCLKQKVSRQVFGVQINQLSFSPKGKVGVYLFLRLRVDDEILLYSLVATKNHVYYYTFVEIFRKIWLIVLIVVLLTFSSKRKLK